MEKKSVLVEKNSAILAKIFNEEFVSSVKFETEKLTPICDFIDFENCTLAEGMDKWLQMAPIPGHHNDWLKRDAMICKLHLVSILVS